MSTLFRALAFALALLAVGAGAQAANDEPSGPDFAIRAGLHGKTTIEKGHFVYDVAAPSKVKDSIEVINLRATKITLNLYAADVLVAEGGGLAPAQSDAEKKSAGAWVKLSRSKVSLGPSASVKIPFTIEVPKFATPGEHLGAVVATADVGRNEQGLAVETRVALQAVVRVKGEVMKGVKVDKPAFSDGTFSVTVHNTGNVLLTPDGRIDVDGRKLALVPSGIYVIPGGEATLTARWADQPSLGRTTARAVVPVLLDGVDAGTFRSEAVTLTFIPWLWIWILAAALLVLVALFMWLRPKLRDRRERRAEEQEVIRMYHRELAARSDADDIA